MNDIGVRIKKLRSEYTMTQKKLADMLALTPKMISFYELGQRIPPMDIVLKLTEIFQISTDYLLGKDELRNDKCSSTAQKIKRLRADFQDTADELAKYLNISLEEYELIESGKKQPDEQTLDLLAMCYEVPMEYLSGSMIEVDDGLNLKMNKLIKRLSNEEKEQVIKYIQLIKKRVHKS